MTSSGAAGGLHLTHQARKLVRTFGAAPDARRRAQAVVSELKRAAGWSVAAKAEIAAVDSWFRGAPSAGSLEPRLRALLAQLSSLHNTSCSACAGSTVSAP